MWNRMWSFVAIISFLITLKYGVFSQEYSYNNPYYGMMNYPFNKPSLPSGAFGYNFNNYYNPMNQEPQKINLGRTEYFPNYNNPIPSGQNPYVYNNFIPNNNLDQNSYIPAASFKIFNKNNNETANRRSLVDNDESINDHPNWRFMNKNTCGETISDRIIGGEYATLGQYPWIALIGFLNSDTLSIDFMCGGTLITSCWIVTAAHCLHNLPSYLIVYEIRLGEYNLETYIDCSNGICAEKSQKFGVKKIVKHKYFNSPKLKNDIALIQLDHPVIITRWVNPICLPYNNLLNKNLISEMAEVAGWGFDNPYTKKQSAILKTVFLPVKDARLCDKAFKKTGKIAKTQICVGGIIGSDSCNGDSGGPLMKVDVVDGTTPKYYIFGIVSYGAKLCGLKPIPAVYTKIAKYMLWILDNISDC